VPADVYPDENDRKAAALWPKQADVPAGYDLDDWIGGEIQVKYRQALADFTRYQDVDKFIATMTKVDTRSSGGQAMALRRSGAPPQEPAGAVRPVRVRGPPAGRLRPLLLVAGAGHGAQQLLPLGAAASLVAGRAGPLAVRRAGYARMALRFEATTYFLLITTMIVPVQIILIPMLPWFRTLGLNAGPQEYLGIALVHTAFGAGWFDVFRRIALPLALPGIVSFAIIDFVFVWNDLLLALTLLDRSHQPLTVGLANLQTPHPAQEDLVAAGTIMAILPPLLLFAALNRFYATPCTTPRWRRPRTGSCSPSARATCIPPSRSCSPPGPSWWWPRRRPAGWA
jgi:hypothetical protein